jgi:hypothetical protein
MMPKAISNPHRALAAAILLRAIKEYKRPSKEIKYSRDISRAFFKEEFFETCCELVDLDPFVVREQLGKRYGIQ